MTALLLSLILAPAAMAEEVADEQSAEVLDAAVYTEALKADLLERLPRGGCTFGSAETAPEVAEPDLSAAPDPEEDERVCLRWIKVLPMDNVGKSYLMMTNGSIERPTTTPVLAGKLTSVPGVRLDGQGRVALRDMKAHELGVVMDGSWMPGATLTSAKGGSPHVTPVQSAPFSIR